MLRLLYGARRWFDAPRWLAHGGGRLFFGECRAILGRWFIGYEFGDDAWNSFIPFEWKFALYLQRRIGNRGC